MKKNETFIVDIIDYSQEGLGIGRKDNFVWFIKDTVIGDRVLCAVLKTKKNYGFARMVEILEPSKDRVEPECPVSRPCGGCQLQSMSYEAQLRFKEEKLRNHLLRLGGLTEEELSEIFQPIVPADSPFRYRNKAQYPVQATKDGELRVGFYGNRSHILVSGEDCLLGIPENRLILAAILGWAKRFSITAYDENKEKGLLRHILLRKGFHTGEIMVCLIINGTKLPHGGELVEELCHLDLSASSGEKRSRSGAETFGYRPGGVRGKEIPSKQEKSGEARLAVKRTSGSWPFPAMGDKTYPGGEKRSKNSRITSISYNINRERSNVIMGNHTETIYGSDTIEDTIDGIRFRISPRSFYQVNPVQTERMYRLALEFAELSGEENVLDLYCGIGTISLFLARKAKKVYGIEIVDDAIRDARRNAELNGLHNTEFHAGAAEEVLPKWYRAHQKEKIDVVCVDPPRKGCDQRCLDTIVEIAAPKLIYVSCDSATLARDIAYLREHGYTVRKLRPVDNFPETVHIETIVLLQKQNS